MELGEGDTVWVKFGHEDTGKRATVKYRAEEPKSYWVEVHGKLGETESI